MKRILVFTIAFLLLFNYTYAQHNDVQFNSLKKRIEKLEAKAKDPKNANNYKFWAKLAKAYLDAYAVNLEVERGYQANLLPLFKVDESSTEPFYGKPLKTETKNGKEIWYYDKIIFYIQDGRIAGWKNLKLPVDEPLIKAYNAYKKAIELDPTGKFAEKSATRLQLKELRDYLSNEVQNALDEKDYDKALKYWEMVMDLFKYPRPKTDTAKISQGMLAYNAAIMAYNAGKYDDAVKFFKKAIEDKYEIGTSYQLMTQILMKQGKEEEAVKLLEEGAKKYPTESKIIFALIDYYKPHGQLDKAFYYLDKALELNPDMAILYLVKADAYNQIYSDYAKQYYELLDKSDSLKKAAFRNRYNKPVHDKLIAQKDSVDKILSEVEQNMNKYFDLAVEWFKKGIEKDPQDPDGYYSLGALYYNRAMAIFARAQKVPTSDTETYNKLIKEYEHYLNLAREQFEKAYELNPNDIQTLQNLSIIYYKLRMYDKHKEMKQKIYELRQKEQQQQQQQNGN